MKKTLTVVTMVFALAMSTMGVATPAEEDFTDELALSFAGPAKVGLGEEHEFAVRLQNRSDLPTRGGVMLEFEVTAGAHLATFEWCGPTFLAGTGGSEADTGAGSGYGDTIQPKEPLDPADYTCELGGFEGWQPIDVSDGPFTTPATGGGPDFPFWSPGGLEYGYTATRLLRITADHSGAIEGEFRAVSYDGEILYGSAQVDYIAQGPVDDTPQDTSPPPAPRLGQPAAGDRSVDLQWSAVTDPTGPITYRLHRSTGSTCTASSPVVRTGTRASTSDEPLTNGTRYRYCVTATDGAGNRSPASNTRTAEPRRTPATCTPLTGDWDASGRDGIGWWCDGRVRLRTADGVTIRYVYGRQGDVPIVADWNGDGTDTVSVIRDGTWFLNNRLAGGAATRSFTYGRVTQGDVPIAGAWTGGPRDLPAIIRDREWHLRFQQSGGNADSLFVYGRLTRGDRPLWGDWNADGRDTIGVVRDGTWLLRNELAGGSADLRYVYGRVLAGDLPVTGDWTGDGRATPAIVRDGRWMLRNEHAGGNADATIVFRQP